MAFAERVTIYIETKVDNAKAGLSGFRQSVAQAEGATGKLKAAASGVGSAMSSALGAITSPAGIAASGAAVAAFAAKSVAAFQNLGVAVGKFSDATGTSAEEASRFVEVFDDLGVAPDTAAASIGRMSKTLATNADALAKYGIEAVKAADGTTDVNETFIAAVDAISKIKNPTDQAAAAQATFGKSWQSMAEIIQGGAPALRASLESVGDAKVLDEADVKSARDLRDALDSLSDAGEGLMLTLGKSLAPAIAKIAKALGEVVTQAEPAFKAIGDGLADTLDDIGPLITGLGKVVGVLGELQSAGGKTFGERSMLDDVKRSALDALNPIDAVKHKWQDIVDQLGKTPELKGGLDVVAEGVTAVGEAAAVSEEDVKAFADAQKDLDKWVRNALDALQEQTDQLAEQAGAFTTAADDQITYNDSLAEFNELNKDAEASISDVRDAAIASAKAHQELYESLTDAAGATATATGKIDAQNSALLASAATAKGPAKAAILDYIAAVNGIPPEKMTDIRAAVARGDLDEAKRLLDEASASREAAFIADANNAALAQTNKDLDAAAHDRTVEFNAVATGLAALTGAFQGAIRAAGGTTTNITNNVTVPRIPNARELARVNAQWARVNGRR
jgi:hypothetical protein